jgi:predicted nuclease with TOPRIM domain
MSAVLSYLTNAEFLRLYRFIYDDEIITRFEKLVENESVYIRYGVSGARDIENWAEEHLRLEDEVDDLEDENHRLRNRIDNLEAELEACKRDSIRLEWLVSSEDSPLDFVSAKYIGIGRWNMYFYSIFEDNCDVNFREDIDNLMRN